MRIGMTYDLRSAYLAEGWSAEAAAEFDEEETIEAIAAELTRLGHEVDRIGHARQLVLRLARGDRWDLVFNICEGSRGIAREAQVPALLELFGIPHTFADPVSLCVCLDKALAKCVAAAAGVPTSPYFVVRTVGDVDSCVLSYPLFAKPLAEGTGKGISSASRVDNMEQLRSTCTTLLDRFQQPVLVEEYLPGREFTVGIVGSGADSRALGTMEILLRPGAGDEIYSFHNKENYEEVVEYRFWRSDDSPLIAEVEATALAAWKALQGRDAGRVDLRCAADGHPRFIEANPLAGLHPKDSDLPILCRALGISYADLIGEIVDQASRRVVPCGF